MTEPSKPEYKGPTAEEKENDPHEKMRQVREDLKLKKAAEEFDKRMARIDRRILCGATAVVTAAVTWKFATTRTRRQMVKTVYELGYQAGERETELEKVVLDHVEFLDQYKLLPLFKKVMGYEVEIVED